MDGTYGAACNTLKTFHGTQLFARAGFTVTVEIWLVLGRSLYIYIKNMLVCTCLQFFLKEIYFKIKIKEITHLDFSFINKIYFESLEDFIHKICF